MGRGYSSDKGKKMIPNEASLMPKELLEARC